MRTSRSAFIPITTALLLTLDATLAHPRQAQNPPAAQPKCDSAEYRQFDFWLGDWDVTTQGQRAGANLVTLEEGGCLIHEHWAGAKGGTGQSLNFYNREDGRWHQVWVSNSGEVLNLTGGYADG